LADKVGLKKILLIGLILFCSVYLGFAYTNSILVYFILFILYGIYAAATEGVSKALISNLVNKSETATAIGTYAGLQSIAALIASTMAGLLWYHFGATATFVTTAAVTLGVIFYLISISLKSTLSTVDEHK
jgi:MFS family permease